jgi:hypothetical protein
MIYRLGPNETNGQAVRHRDGDQSQVESVPGHQAMSAGLVGVFEDYDAFLDASYVSGLGDGLPLSPPTPFQVDSILESMSLPRDVVLGSTPDGTAITAGDVAIGAVLAGCRAEYGPVVLASVRAFLDDVNARAPWVADGMQAIIVNGPIRSRIRLNSNDGVLGPGWRANATIGRALRLIVTTAFRVPRASGFGDPGQYSMCVGEDEEGSPWTSLQVDRGFRSDQSTVTVHSCTSFKQVMSHSMSPDVVADSLKTFLQGKASATDWYGPDVKLSIVILMGNELRRRLAPTWSKQALRHRLYEGITEDPDAPLHRVNVGSEEELVLVATGGVAFDTAWVLVAPGTRISTCAVE